MDPHLLLLADSSNNLILMKLKDKVFIITGATSGMGKGIALEFAEEGALLVLGGRNFSKAEKVLNDIKKRTVKPFSFPVMLEMNTITVNWQQPPSKIITSWMA